MYADVVFKNGKVVTVDKEDRICEAVAVRDNKIIYVGENACAESLVDDQTEVIDLQGRALVPGFIDAHMHIGLRGQNAAVIIDCNSDDVPTIEGILEKIRQAAANTPKGAWIKATGYEQNKLKDKRHPTRDELDEAAPDHPVQLTRCCMHMGVYNSKALELAGITGPEMFPEGQVVVDENGRMTGLLKEGACTYMWDKVTYTKEEYMASFKAASELLLSYGITSVHDAGFYGEKTIGLMQEAVEKDYIKVRLFNLTYHIYGKQNTIDWIDALIRTGLHSGLGDDRFKIGHVKILLDGSTSGPSSYTKKPYSHDPQLKGIIQWTQEETDAIMKKAHDAGFQVSAHAVGDAAVEIILTAIERALADNPRPHRHRIEHCGIISGDQLERIKKAGIIPISNPGFFNENASAYIQYYGDRVNDMFPLKSYLDNGIITALGSDTPVIEADTMIGLYGAVARKDKRSGETAGACQQVSISDALRMYTINGAYAAGEEETKGSIEVGKLADMAVLSGDILQTEVEAIKDMRVDMTMLDGKIVYKR